LRQLPRYCGAKKRHLTQHKKREQGRIVVLAILVGHKTVLKQETKVDEGEHSGSSHQTRFGVILILLAAALFGLSGIFTKIITADAWTILTWRGLFGAALIGVYLFFRPKSKRERALGLLGWKGWLLATVGSLSSIAFIAAFKLTYVANVTVIYALVPFVAALLEWAILGQRVQWQTMLAALVSTAGVGLLVFGTLGSVSITGDLLAIIMMLLNALYVVLIRVFKSTDVVLAGALASLQLFFAGWLFTQPLEVSSTDFYYILLFGIAFGMASILWTEGARLITAAEVGVLNSGDIPLAILFAWILLSEVPPFTSILGAAIVLLAVVAYSHWKTRGTHT
jgi:drug/metabolite transporter (DMT)-like permease